LETVDGRVFKFYTELVERITTTFIQKNLCTVEWSNFALCLRVLQKYTWLFWPVRAYWFYVYIYAHVYFNCYMRHWTDCVFVGTW